MTLFNGFWILFKTQLGNTDILVRTVTDALWMSNKRLRDWKHGAVHKIYYGVLLIFSLWGALAIRMASYSCECCGPGLPDNSLTFSSCHAAS